MNSKKYWNNQKDMQNTMNGGGNFLGYRPKTNNKWLTVIFPHQ